MIRINLLVAVLIGWAAVSLNVSAQDHAPVKVELRLLAFTSDLQQAECFAQDPLADPTAASIETPIKTYLNHQFSTISLKSKKVVFTSKPDRASLTREGETLLETTLPDGVTSAILLVVPGKPGDKAKCRALIINDSKKAFPAGSYHATNMSSSQVRLTLEQTNFDFNPAQVIVIEKPPTRDGRMSSMKTFVVKGKELKPVSTGLWPCPEKTRGLLVFFQDPISGNIQLRAFDDVAPRTPQETATVP